MTISTSKPKLFSTPGQICKLIAAHLVAKLARETGVEDRARTFTPWSHVVSLLYAQLAHALSFVTGRLQAIRGAKAPSRIMQVLKSIGAREMFRQFPAIGKQLWGGEFWSDGGYIGTVGEGTTEEVVRKYIQQQGSSREKELYHQLKLFG